MRKKGRTHTCMQTRTHSHTHTHTHTHPHTHTHTHRRARARRHAHARAVYRGIRAPSVLRASCAPAALAHPPPILYHTILYYTITILYHTTLYYISAHARASPRRLRGPGDGSPRLSPPFRHRLNGHLAYWVPSSPGKHTFQNFTIQTHPKNAGKKNN